jgi:ribonuclease Z
MDLDVVFVGTAASVPSAGRGLSSMLIRRGGERILIDCGEGTQRQLMRSTGLADLDVVLITHLHADHVLGLPGMLKTFGLRDRTEPLRIAGPPGLERFWRDMERVVGRLPFAVDLLQLGDGPVWHGDGYVIDAIRTDHGVPSLGYVLSEDDRPGRFDVEAARALGVTPGEDFGVLQRGGEVQVADGSIVRSDQVVGEARTGRRIVYSGDTAACSEVRDAARDATLLVHEATFLREDAERAAATSHSTALDAGLTAAAANVGMLALTHISTRYLPRAVEAEAREVFPNTVLARDFDRIDLPFPERGEPRHEPRGARPGRATAADDATLEPALDDRPQPAT